MAVHDRDYMRSPAPRSVWLQGTVTFWIIGINVLLWIVFASAFNNARGSSLYGTWAEPDGLYGFLSEYLVLHPLDVFGKWRLWEPFTAFWMHAPEGFNHVFYNMLLLYFFGRGVESWLGTRGYLRLYLGGGLASTLMLVLVAYLIDDATPALGASGCVFAVMVWIALQDPKRSVYVFFVFPLPLWLLVGVLMVGKELLTVGQVGLSAGSAVGHLAGAGWGFAVWRFLPRHPTGKRRGPGWWMVILRQGRAGGREANRQRVQGEKARVEALLQKISDDGIETLTEEEKGFLQEASKRYR